MHNYLLKFKLVLNVIWVYLKRTCILPFFITVSTGLNQVYDKNGVIRWGRIFRLPPYFLIVFYDFLLDFLWYILKAIFNLLLFVIDTVTYPFREALLIIYAFFILWKNQIRDDLNKYLFKYLRRVWWYVKRAIKMIYYWPREIFIGLKNYLLGPLIRVHAVRYPRTFRILKFLGFILYIITFFFFLRGLEASIEILYWLYCDLFSPYVLWRGPGHVPNWGRFRRMLTDTGIHFFRVLLFLFIGLVFFLIFLVLKRIYFKIANSSFTLRAYHFLFHRVWLGMGTWRHHKMVQFTLDICKYVLILCFLAYLFYWMLLGLIFMVLVQSAVQLPFDLVIFVIIPLIVTELYLVLRLVAIDSPFTKYAYLLQIGQWVSPRKHRGPKTTNQAVIDDFKAGFIYYQYNTSFRFRYRICKFYPFLVIRRIYFVFINMFLITWYSGDKKKIFFRMPAEEFVIFHPSLCGHHAVKVGPFLFCKQMNSLGQAYFARLRPFFEWYNGEGDRWSRKERLIDIIPGMILIFVYLVIYLFITGFIMYLHNLHIRVYLEHGILILWPWDNVYETKLGRFWHAKVFNTFWRRVLKTFLYEFLFRYVFPKFKNIQQALDDIEEANTIMEKFGRPVDFAFDDIVAAMKKYEETYWNFHPEDEREDADFELEILRKGLFRLLDSLSACCAEQEVIIEKSEEKLGFLLSFFILWITTDATPYPPDYKEKEKVEAKKAYKAKRWEKLKKSPKYKKKQKEKLRKARLRAERWLELRREGRIEDELRKLEAEDNAKLMETSILYRWFGIKPKPDLELRKTRIEEIRREYREKRREDAKQAEEKLKKESLIYRFFGVKTKPIGPRNY